MKTIHFRTVHSSHNELITDLQLAKLQRATVEGTRFLEIGKRFYNITMIEYYSITENKEDNNDQN